jgi:hypothetical protein
VAAGRDDGLSRLDRDRAASLADEGGASAVAFEAQDPDSIRGTRLAWPRPVLWAVGTGLGLLAGAVLLFRWRRPNAP